MDWEFEKLFWDSVLTFWEACKRTSSLVFVFKPYLFFMMSQMQQPELCKERNLQQLQEASLCTC